MLVGPRSQEKTGCPWFCVVFVVLVLGHLLVIWNARLLPFIDLPFRLAAAQIYKYYGAVGNHFADFYAVDLFPKPNIVHILFCSLKAFPSVEFANKVFYSLHMVLFPLSVLLVIRKLKGSPWLSLLSFLLIYNYSVGWGFSEFTLALPVVILFFYFLLDYFNGPRLKSRIMVGLLLLTLFFIHSLAAFFALFIFLVCCIYLFRRSLKQLVIELTAALPLLIIIAAWWFHDPLQYPHPDADWTYLLNYYTRQWLPHSLIRRDSLLFYDNFSLFKGDAGKYAALFFSLSIIGAWVYGWLHRRRASLPTQPDQERQMRPGLYLFFFASLFFYIFIPHKLYGNYYLYPRFAVFVFVAIIFLAALTPAKSYGRLFRIATVAVCAIHLVLWADYFRDFNRENRRFTGEFLPSNTRDRVLAGLIYHYRFRGRPVYIHFPNYHIIWNRGIAATCVMDFSFGTIRRKAGKERLPSNLNMEWVGRRPWNYTGLFDGVDYMLVKGKIPSLHLKHFKSFRQKKSIPGWSLYEKIGLQPAFDPGGPAARGLDDH